jgi:hypothetical protein
MDTARQIVRWALPAWITYFFLVFFILVTFLTCDRDQMVYIEILRKANELLVPLGVATVPLGFLIYQAYYWLYWYARIPHIVGRFLVNPVDRGSEILDGVSEHVDFKSLFDHPLIQTRDPYQRRRILLFHPRFKDAKVMQEYRQNWHLSDSVWYWALADERYESTAEFLEKRNQMISDIYHSLGACYTGLLMAFVVYLLLFACVTLSAIPIRLGEFITLLQTGAPITWLLAISNLAWTLLLRTCSVVLNSLVFVAVFGLFRGGRMASFDALLSLKRDVITTVLLDKPRANKAADRSQLPQEDCCTL